MTRGLRPHELADKSRRPDDDQRDRLVGDLQEAISFCVNAQPRLERAARDLGGEFPSGGDGGQVPFDREPTDDDGPVTGSITERRAIDGMRSDAEQAGEALAHLKETIAHIKKLHTEVKRCFPVATANTSLAGCKSCSRLIDSQGNPTFSAQHRGELCSWCYDFNRLWNKWPPVELLDLHSRGIKVSENRIRETLKRAV